MFYCNFQLHIYFISIRSLDEVNEIEGSITLNQAWDPKLADPNSDIYKATEKDLVDLVSILCNYPFLHVQQYEKTVCMFQLSCENFNARNQLFAMYRLDQASVHNSGRVCNAYYSWIQVGYLP